MIRLLALVFSAVLSGCSNVTPSQPDIRDESVPISITTRGSLNDMSGDWVVRGAVPESASIGSVTLTPRDDGLIDITLRDPGCSADCHRLSGTW